LARVSFFDERGSYLKSETLSPGFIGSTPWSFQGGERLSSGLQLVLPAASARALGSHPVEFPIALASHETGKIDLIRMLKTSGPIALRIQARNGATGYGTQPLDPRPFLGAGPGGDWFYVVDHHPAEEGADRWSFDVLVFDAIGQLSDSLSVSYTPKPFDEATLTRMLGVFRVQAAERIDEEEWLKALWRPSNLPPVSQVVPYDRGIWVAREEFQQWLTWEKVPFSGEPTVAFRTSPRFRALGGSEGGIVGVVPDSLGVPEVVHLVRDPTGR
jgi:hypothetical protein